ncbi:hypothetical protein BO85DRAFT_3113 [Aspergillus piperis CBS 112811]|uniref:Uncharacterized protein n=1 Tax=Aspergillus piperis CBS 112811 TaxID=1448313 RepID=A0A8G1VR03_9EURO|nr:hypothetical protein BO85DRAFT_3113 [Aspergillus piperis CBS 112811]RAH62584.1 hypothetical protein BO85DRAFT_3113 [Aspergillus piperis CBS 112811]
MMRRRRRRRRRIMDGRGYYLGVSKMQSIIVISELIRNICFALLCFALLCFALLCFAYSNGVTKKSV